MLSIGTLKFDGTPRIAVPFRDGMDAGSIERAVREGADIAELRIDEFANRDAGHVIGEAKRFVPLPVLGTIRCEAEGGKWVGVSDTDRLELYRAIIPYVDAVDVELSSGAILSDVIAAAHAAHKPVIVSFHDFARTPECSVLDDVARRARDAGGDIVKVAAMCTAREDVRRLAAFTIRNAEAGVVAIGMGPIGVSTRVLFPALGSLFTFAAFGQGTAPGQMQLGDLKSIFQKIYPSADQAG